MAKKMTNEQKRHRRHVRSRSQMVGTAQRPRLSVHRTLRGMFVQLIDDTQGKTLVSVNSKKDTGSGDAGERTGKKAQAYLLGKAVAEKAKAAGIEAIVFDRSGYSYHGRVKALAEGARDGGLQF